MQLPLLGTEQEHQPHHDRQGRLVEHLFRHPGQQLPPEVLVGPVERMDQHLDRPPHLIAKLLGDFLLVRRALLRAALRAFDLRDVEEAAGRQQAAEGPQRDRLFEPEVGVPRGVAGGFALGGIHQHPVFAVGHEAQPHARAVEQLGHPGVGRCFPRRLGDVAGEFLRPGVGLHQQPGLLRAGIDHDDAGPQQLVVLGNLHLQRLGDRLPLDQHSLVEVERLAEDEPDPLLMRGRIGPPLLHRLQPVPVLLPQQPGLLRVVGLQPGVERLHQHRQAQERARDRHERKPFGVVAGDGHGYVEAPFLTPLPQCGHVRDNYRIVGFAAEHLLLAWREVGYPCGHERIELVMS